HGEAEAALRRALDLQEGLARDFPAVPEYGQELAGSYVNFGHLVRVRSRPAESLTWYAKAVSLLEANLRQVPRELTTRRYLRNAHIGRANALGDLGRFGEAAAAWDLALKFNDRPADAGTLKDTRTAAMVAAGLAEGSAWPLLWGWPRP